MTITYMPHQERVITERDELQDKLDKLNAFINASPVFTGLSKDERIRLGKQSVLMGCYLQVLNERIAAF